MTTTEEPFRLEWERSLVALGLLGLLLTAVCAALALVHGSWFVEPEGRLLDALRFELGSAIFFLTTAALVPLAGFSPAGRGRWVTTLVSMGVYFLGIETVQAARGLDPRFTEVGGTVDQVAGLVFGLTALLLTALTAVLGARFFRADTLSARPELRAAIRYGFAAVALSFGVGLAMSVMQGRTVGPAGSLMPLHAAGLHGIQAVPLLALVARARGVAAAPRSALVHLGGVGWLLLCAGLLAQGWAGRPPVELSSANAVAAVGALAFLAAAARVAFASRPLPVASQPAPRHPVTIDP